MLRHLSRTKIATDIPHFLLPKVATTTNTMTRKTKLSPIFRLSSEQLETRVNLSATAQGSAVDRSSHVAAPLVAHVKVNPSNAVVMPLKAAGAEAASQATIPFSGSKGPFAWQLTQQGVQVSFGNSKRGVEMTFSSPETNVLVGQGMYYYSTNTLTAEVPFEIMYQYDPTAKTVTITYEDASNKFSTTVNRTVSISKSGDTVTITGDKKTTTITKTSDGLAVSSSKTSGTSQLSFTPDGLMVTQARAKKASLGVMLDSFRTYAANLKVVLDKVYFQLKPNSVATPQAAATAAAFAGLAVSPGQTAYRAQRVLNAFVYNVNPDRLFSFPQLQGYVEFVQGNAPAQAQAKE